MPPVPAEVSQSVEQLQKVWRLCVEDRRTGEIRDDEALTVRWADNAFPFWNTLANIEVGADRRNLEAALRRASEYMRGQKCPGFLWLFEEMLAPDARASLAEIADRAGLGLALSGYGMAGDVLPLGEDPKHPDLEFIRVRTEAEVLAYGDVNCRAYGFPPEAVQAGFAGSKIWTKDICAYMGLKEGVPVAVAATVPAGDCLFVMLVATLAEHQRKGYGEAITRKALYEGGKATGLRRATLHATMAGMPVYERIGLKKVASIGFYGLKA
jgi:GNAT superfamily N-acetyltransferase